MNEIEKFIRVKNTGIRIELDKTKDDSGIFLWNADGFVDVEFIDNLIESLNIAKEELEEEDVN